MAIPAIAVTRRKLRVLVVGLFRKQYEMICREYPDLDLHAAINNTRAGIDNSSHGMNVSADRIVVMTRFASHSATKHIDKSIATPCNGGFTELRRLLDSYAMYSRALAPAPVRAVRIETPVDSLVDYSPFRTCKRGDVLEFVRPEGVAAHVFAQNVNEARRFYEANGGVQSDCEIKGGKARVVILDRVRPMLEQAERELTERRRAELTLSFADQRLLEKLFRDVYLISLRVAPFATDAHHATVANIAVDGWLEMFRTKGE